MGLKVSGTGSRYEVEAPYLAKSGVSFGPGVTLAALYDSDFDEPSWFFEDEGIVVEEVVEERPVTVNVIEPGGMHGTVFSSSFLEQRAISLRCRAFLNEWDEFDSLVNELFGRMAAMGQLALSVRSRPDTFCLAVAESLDVGERIGGTGIGEFTLNLTMPDPTWYSMHMTKVTITEDTADIIYEGTVPTPAVIETEVMSGWFTTTVTDDGQSPQTIGYKGSPGLPLTMTETVRGAEVDTVVSPRISRTDGGALLVDSSTRRATCGGSFVGFMPGYDRWPVVTQHTTRVSLPFGGKVTDGGELRYRARYA